MKIIIIFLSILLYSIQIDSSINDFTYAKFFQLINERYIICTEKGIYLYDSQLNDKLSETIFDSEITSTNDLYFINIEQFSTEDGGNVIVLYKTKFYFFSSLGILLFEDDLTFTTEGVTYTLVPYKNNDMLNFIVGYLGTNKATMIGYYNIDISNKKITEIVTTNFIMRSNSGVAQTTTIGSFSCQIMVHKDYNEVLTCFYVVTYYLGINSYNITDNFSEITSIGYSCDKSLLTTYIYSAVNSEKDKTLACCSSTYGGSTFQGICITYDINSNTISSVNKFSENAQPSFNSITLSYSKKTNEYITTCLDYSSYITSIKYDKDLNIIDETDDNISKLKVSDCSTLYYTSMIYLSDTNTYSLVNSCSSTVIKINTLPDEYNPTNVNPTPSITEDSSSSQSEASSNINEESSDINEASSIINEASSNINEVSSLTSTIIYSNSNNFSSSNISYKVSDSTISITSNSINNSNSDKKINKTLLIEEGESCPDQYLYAKKNTNECTQSCDTKEIINNDCSINHLSLDNIEEITKDMRNIINNTNISQDTNIVIEGENAVYQIISSDNMKENKNKNISIIDLGQCSTILKEYYKVDDLIIFKMDLKLNNTPPTIINYEVYNPITLEKLNLSLCEGQKITIYSPYTPSQESLIKLLSLNASGYDLYNPNDSFYTDICSTFTSENGTDILLSDRKSDYFENITLCEDGCTYDRYDYSFEKVKCECDVKEEFEISQEEINNNISVEKQFFSSFGLDSFSNLKVIKCFSLVFSKLGQKNNKGSIIFICVILIVVVLFITFHVNQVTNIGRILRMVIDDNFPQLPEKNKHSSPNIKKRSAKTNNKVLVYYKRNSHNNHKDTQKDVLIDENRTLPSNNKLEKYSKKKSKFYRKSKINIKAKTHTHSSNNNNNTHNKKLISLRDSFFSKEKYMKKKNTMFYENKKEYKYNEEELNSLDYNKAIEYDKRTYFQYYWFLTKSKQLILFTFVLNNDYNILIIKLSLLLFSFSLYFTVSALFFEDETMHKIYESQGNLDFLLKIPNILYSTIISSVISMLIKYLALSNKDILKIKQIKNKEKALKESTKILSILKIKLNLFFMLCFLFLTFFWYFISAFCAVYENTQEILIENTMSSFGLSLLYPFGINLLPGIFRIPSLRAEKKNLGCLYKFSKIIALI